jgi:hypothetical protein
MQLGRWIACAMALVLSGCATGYHGSSIDGGYSAKEVEPGIWRVGFSGNGFTTPESVQTYWLYRSAELALEKGFDGFDILSNLRLVGVPPANPLVHLAKGGTIIFVPGVGVGSRSSLEGDIQLIKRPFEPAPPKVFDAAALKERLEPYVTGQKCNDNVCPHVHHYLRPDDPPPADKNS